ncbi:glycerol-3-phosphate acyltransferase [Savagea serpentis]|uniref:glycerol-3-phosphate acyltransferase n=1 Tax=Savagea serpentis TaxID=2785297 RepID=UPI002E2B1513|nr:glycerol-3-phosphate acyltransferase [Savagea serpentis]
MWSCLSIAIGYLFGSLHGSVLASRLSGRNLKELGTKNAGASNAFIELGKGYGMLVAIVDISKGAIAIGTMAILLHQFSSVEPNSLFFLYILTGTFAVIGHNFPIWMKFNGGKGTATMIGMMLALDWHWGLFALITFLIITWLTDYIVIGGLMLYLVLIVETLTKHSVMSFWVALGLLAVMIYQHRENFERIHLKTEKRVSAAFRSK